ncbi:hypothetical protein ABDJ41_19605 [Pedobacter sp. ASV1-7]|uniref:hypothetical protein n=1 Tax=Pedobacter sp. ASV1-7 TaxID=3145237 RepID=UPI0032E9178E
MKINYFPLVALMTIPSFIACNQNPSGTKSNTDAKENLISQIRSSESAEVKTLFKEGKIDIQITTPGTALGELLQQIDPTKGNVAGQMKVLAEKLSPKEREVLEAQNKKVGIMNLAILMIPLKSEIYLKGAEATAKFDAMTFHGENNVNEAKKEGTMYIKSQNSNKDMTIRYTGDSFHEMAKNELKNEDYYIEKTNETSIVAGYNCTKSVYTLKESVPTNNKPGGIPASSVYRLEVWTSTEMPKSVNFLHPLYIKEDAGIMKILIQYEKDNGLQFLYEFTKVENRAVTPAEMQIKKTEKIYDFGKDKMAVGMQMMGVVFGM